MNVNKTAALIFGEDYQVVKELKGGRLLYPKNIPSDRGHTALVLEIIITILLWAVCIYFASRDRNYSSSAKYSWYCTTSNILLIIFCALIWRVCNLLEEVQHLHARYDGSIGSVLKSAFQFDTLPIIIIVLCIASFIGMWLDVKNPLMYLWEFGPEAYVFSLMTAVMIGRLIKLDENRLDTALKLEQSMGLDYGSGMAYSYFYGYLNIVLPWEGDEKKGLEETIGDYEAKHGVTIPVKKLFILIPTSLRIPPDLREVSYNWLEIVAKMTSVVKTRAGTKERTYHNTVYKIHPGGIGQGRTPVYVITEGATPVLTFYEVLQHSGKDSTSYNEYSKEIVGSFYRTLRHIIKSKPEVRDLCELIFYDDLDADGNNVNVAKILLDKIQEQVALAS